MTLPFLSANVPHPEISGSATFHLQGKKKKKYQKPSSNYRPHPAGVLQVSSHCALSVLRPQPLKGQRSTAQHSGVAALPKSCLLHWGGHKTRDTATAAPSLNTQESPRLHRTGSKTVHKQRRLMSKPNTHRLLAAFFNLHPFRFQEMLDKTTRKKELQTGNSQ